MSIEGERRQRRHLQETCDRMAMLWTQGLSTLEIGKRLGISKSAVCGLRRRLDLPQRGPAIKPDSSLKAGQTQEPKPMPPRKTALPPEGTYRRPLATSLPKGSTCQWPIGDPAKPGFRMCGGTRIELPGNRGLSPYCAVHYAAAYTADSRREMSRRAKEMAG